MNYRPLSLEARIWLLCRISVVKSQKRWSLLRLLRLLFITIVFGAMSMKLDFYYHHCV